jgi:hypothetical protein
VGPLVNSAGIKESDHEEMCNILNDYFGTVFTEESIIGKLPEVIKNVKDDNGSMLSNVDITKEDITHTSVLTPFSPRSGVSVRLPMTKNQIPHFAMHPYPVHHHAVTLLSPCPSPLVPSIPSAVDPFLSHLLPQTLTPS